MTGCGPFSPLLPSRRVLLPRHAPQVEAGEYLPSNYAMAAKAKGFELITWTLERSGPLVSGGGWCVSVLREIARDRTQ
mgnify:CR=1 FL=1